MTINRPPPPPPPPNPPLPPRPQGSPSSMQQHSNQSQQRQHDNNNNDSLSSTESIIIPLQEEEEEEEEEQQQGQLEQSHQHPQNYQQSTITIRSATIPGDIIQLLITPQMTHNDLAHCIAHAAISPPQTNKLLDSWSMEDGEANWTRIAGLFRESDGIFIPLSLILRSPGQYVDDIFRISRHKHVLKHSNSQKGFPASTSIFHSTRALIFIVLVGIVSSMIMMINSDYGLDIVYEYVDTATTTIQNIPTFLIEMTINHPLKELYRYGPNVIGWEGSPLPSICAQITHMGDENFWSKNIDECEKIYSNKEMAMLHVRRPILYLIIALAMFFAIQSLLKTWAIQKQNRPSREMVETYEAYRLVMKVLRRGMTPNRNANYR